MNCNGAFCFIQDLLSGCSAFMREKSPSIVVDPRHGAIHLVTHAEDAKILCGEDGSHQVELPDLKGILADNVIIIIFPFLNLARVYDSEIVGKRTSNYFVTL